MAGKEKQVPNTNSSPYMFTCAIRIQYELHGANDANHLYARVFDAPCAIRLRYAINFFNTTMRIINPP